jgi:hypothetical protein
MSHDTMLPDPAQGARQARNGRRARARRATGAGRGSGAPPGAGRARPCRAQTGGYFNASIMARTRASRDAISLGGM